MFFKYLKAAFNETFGMPVPLSWMILAFTAVAAYLDLGFVLVGIGVLAMYLFCLANSSRYMRFTDARTSFASQKTVLEKVNRQVAQLNHADASRYHDLVGRCDLIMKQQQHDTVPDELQQQAMGLSRLAGFYLQLLVSKNAIENMPAEDDINTIKKTMAALTKRIAESTSQDLIKSLNGQLDILKQRAQAKQEMSDRLEYVKSELERIEQQVELLREQTVADTAPSIVSDRIDAVTNTLSSTNEWMKKNKELLGQVDDVLSEPPPVLQILQQQ